MMTGSVDSCCGKFVRLVKKEEESDLGGVRMSQCSYSFPVVQGCLWLTKNGCPAANKYGQRCFADWCNHEQRRIKVLPKGLRSLGDQLSRMACLWSPSHGFEILITSESRAKLI